MATSDVRSLILGTAGHIDHGKTSLVRALTGIDTDRLPEEKARGITIDIGFAKLDLGPVYLGIVDVPGHERFVKNMLAGAVGIDLAMLVIAADDSIMPQTREHLSILQMLDIEHGLIALTKTDLVEPDWCAIVEDDIAGFVRGTFLEGAPIVRTAVAAGKGATGCEELKQALRDVCAKIQSRPSTGAFRLPVDRAFSAQGVGTIITGTVWSGTLAAGAEVEWLPSRTPVRVRTVQSHGRDQPAVSRGQRAAANLIGAHHEAIRRGHELATPGYLKPSRRLVVELRCTAADTPFPIKHRGRYRLHLGTQEVMARVSLLEGTLLQPGETAVATLICAEPTTATSGQPFVLRMESPLLTIGGGHVLQPAPKRMIRRRKWNAAQKERLLALRSKDARQRAAAAAFFFGAGEWTTLDLCRDANLHPDQAGAIVEQMQSDGSLVHVQPGTRVPPLHRDVLAEIENKIFDALKALHAAHPVDQGFPRSTVAAKVQRLGAATLVNAILDRLIKHGRIGGDDQSVMLTKHAPKLSPQQIAARERILSVYTAAGMAPPLASDLGEELGVSAADMRQLMSLCVAQKLLVYLGSGWYLTTAAEAAMRTQAIAALEANPTGLSMSQLRDALSTTRKYAVPFGEYLDRVGVTKRIGDVRVLAGS